MRYPAGRLLIGAGACLLVVALLGLMVATRWDELHELDNGLGSPAEAWTAQHHLAAVLLLGIEAVFGTIGTITYAAVLVIGLLLKQQRVAALWVVVVMICTSATTTGLKLLFHRHRPEWQDPVQTLTSFSFPSGHASGIASGMGVVAILTALYLEKSLLRSGLLIAAFALVVVVGADRVLLGVHNLSDVLAGYAVAGFWLCVATVLIPLRRAQGSGHGRLPSNVMQS